MSSGVEFVSDECKTAKREQIVWQSFQRMTGSEYIYGQRKTMFISQRWQLEINPEHRVQKANACRRERKRGSETNDKEDIIGKAIQN